MAISGRAASSDAREAKTFCAAIRRLPKGKTCELERVGHLFQGADQRDGVHVVEISDVCDAEELALHLALSIGEECRREVGF